MKIPTCRETFGRTAWHGRETVPQQRGVNAAAKGTFYRLDASVSCSFAFKM
jgi:hypothetical protein